MNQQPNNEKIRATIQKLIDGGLQEEAAFLAKKHGVPLKVGGEDHTETWLSKFITQHPAMLQLKDSVRILAKHQDSVLIQGESGTGKEILAHALHGNRPTERFIAINCAGMPEHLIESELFGHVKGAFTGADRDKPGLFKSANDGTLFLDEVGDLPLQLQAKFLRAIQDKRIRKVGSNEEEQVNCRIVAATHHNLLDLVRDKSFRLDLYARLSTFLLQTWPIRDRLEDVLPIIESLLPNGTPFNKVIPVDFPLNVRTIQQEVRRYLVFGAGSS